MLAHDHPGRASAIHGRIEFWPEISRHVREHALPRDRADPVLRQFIKDEVAGLWLFIPASATKGMKPARQTLFSKCPKRGIE